MRGVRRGEKVRGLVGRWEERNAKAAAAAREREVEKKVPIVYPLHVNKFVRRSSIRTPVRPQSPMYLSGMGEETVMHAPRPTRAIPSISTPPEETSLLTPKGRGYISPVARLQGTRRHCVRHGREDHIRQHDHASKRRAFAGTKHMLAKSGSGAYVPTGHVERRQMDATSPWIAPMDPVGPERDVLMGVVDACPDCLQEFDIRKREMRQGFDEQGGRTPEYCDVTPTMLAVRRPVAEPSHLYAPASHSHNTEMRAFMDPDLLSTTLSVYPGRRQNVVRPGAPVAGERSIDSASRATSTKFTLQTQRLKKEQHEAGYVAQNASVSDPRWHATPYEPAPPPIKQAQYVPPMKTDQPANGSSDLVVSRPLQQGLNAVVVEHEGHLRRVILNASSDTPQVERLRRLSLELASVAKAMAQASTARQQGLDREVPQHSVILDKQPSSSYAMPATERVGRTSSSISELLSMIDQAAGEIHLESQKSPTQYMTNRRQSLATTVGRGQSLVDNEELPMSLCDMPSPGQQSAHRQGMNAALKTAKQQMESVKGSTPLERQSVPANLLQTTMPSHVQTLKEADNSLVATPKPAPFVRKVQPALQSPSLSGEQPKTPPTYEPTTSAKASGSVPTLATTQPASSGRPSVASVEPAFERPPAARITLVAEPLPANGEPPETDDPTKAAIKQPSLSIIQPMSATKQTPTPRALDSASQTHSYFPNFLSFNPFHRRTPQPSTSSDLTANSTLGDSIEATNPLTAASKLATRPAITMQANPYRHAPTAPMDMYFAQHADPGVKEQAQVIRAAMRMEKSKAVQEAAAAERMARRFSRESAGPGGSGGGRKHEGAGDMKKGWFG